MKRILSDLIIGPKATIREAIKAIDNNGVRGVFVCDEDGGLLGIVMDQEVRRAVLRNVNLDNSLRTVMKTSPFSLTSGLDPKTLKAKAVSSGRFLIPVVDQAMKVVDYVCLADVLNEVPTSHFSDNGNGKGLTTDAKVLVIGGEGYIGSVLVDKLLRLGHSVRSLDLQLYSKDALNHLVGHDKLEILRGDCRNEDAIERALEGMDAVVHLGEIVGDPACSVDENFTIDTNFMATSRLVDLCVKQGVPRFVFTSSCSVYGQSDELVNETSGLNPVSLYAKCKIECERAILATQYPNFHPTILRLATVHGQSWRQRFDLVVNLLTIKGLVDGAFQVFGGSQWRPFISTRDVCNGINKVLTSPDKKVSGEIFNLGDSRENYTIAEVGKIIADLLPEAECSTRKEDEDARNYRVSFDKIRDGIGFTCEYTIEDTVRELASSVRHDGLYEDYAEPKYHNVKTLK